jgi:tetratricopeptide (TPR) repeat protein
LASGRGIVSDGPPGSHSPFAAFILNFLDNNTRPFFSASTLIAKAKENSSISAEGGYIINPDNKGGEFYFFLKNRFLERLIQMREMCDELKEYLITTNASPLEKKARCEEFLKGFKNIRQSREADEMRNDIKKYIKSFSKMLDEDKKNLEKAQRKKESGILLYNRGKYQKAKENFLEFNRINPGDDETKEYLNKIEEWEKIHVVNPKAYILYKSKNQDSNILVEIKVRLYGLFPKLPPEKYLENLIGDKRNDKGYWEAEFDGHIMVYIPGLKIFVDKYEVSYALYEKYMKKKRKGLNIPLIKILSGCHPVIVTYKEAIEYCKQMGMRLLTEAEWEVLAGKDMGNIYSWGNEEVDKDDIYRANFKSFKDGNQLIAPVKSYEKFVSPYGLVNLSGNVWEWVQGKKCKGGGFLSEKEDLKISKSAAGEDFVGFRCVKDVKK